MKLTASCLALLFRLFLGIGIGYGLFLFGKLLFLPIQNSLSMLEPGWFNTLLLLFTGTFIFSFCWLIWLGIGILVFKSGK